MNPLIVPTLAAVDTRWIYVWPETVVEHDKLAALNSLIGFIFRVFI